MNGLLPFFGGRWAARLACVGALVFAMPAVVGAAEEKGGAAPDEEHIYLLRSYRYLPSGERPNAEVGLHLCGTRCNALAADYLTYTTAGGWYLQKVAENRPLVVDLGNPFMTGQCLCEVDEFLVKVNDLYISRPHQLK